MNILDILRPDNIKPIIKDLNICDDKIIRTRNAVKRSTSSCRVWQFTLCLLNYYFNLYGEKILSDKLLINKICELKNELFQKDMNDRSYISDVILLNRPVNVIQINSFFYLNSFSNTNENQMYYMCIYSPEIDFGSILHFFYNN
jgi:hypothetical protein